MKNLFFIAFLCFNFCVAQQVNTLAGSNMGFSDGNVMLAKFNYTAGICSDTAGNLYVADEFNNRIRKITPDGMVTTLAGSGLSGSTNGPGTSAKFNCPHGLCVDTSGNVYVVERIGNKVRKIVPDGTVSTFATGFLNPYGICIDTNGILYVADSDNYKIKKITPQGVVTTFAGGNNGYQDGQGTSAGFSSMRGICVDTSGNVFVADYFIHKIRKITPTGYVSTVAGTTIGYQDGDGAAAQFNYPTGITVDSLGNLYVAEEYNNTIRKIDANGVVSTLAGTIIQGYLDGSVTIARFNQPNGVYVDTSGIIYVADSGNCRIRTITGRSLVINENNTINFKLFPNPVTSILNIQLPENIEFKKAIIYNALGQIVKAENKIEINVSDLSKGNYIIQVVSNAGSTTKIFNVK